MDARSVVEGYYEALDEGRYGYLESILAPEFVQQRPDRTFEGREAFVQFMANDRPTTDTTHDLDSIVVDSDRAAVRGRLLDANDDALFEFADHFLLEDGQLVRLDTYTRPAEYD